MIEKLTFWVTIMVTVTLCLVVNAMVGVFLYGLFLPNSVIDNKDIFPIIAPAFSTIVGGFIGWLAAIKINKKRCILRGNCYCPMKRAESATTSPVPLCLRRIIFITMRKLVFALLVTSEIVCLAQSPAPPKKRLAVFDFDNAGVAAAPQMIFFSTSTPNVGKSVADLLLTRLVQGGKASLIERAAIDKLIAEQNFSNSDRAEIGRAHV